MHLLLIITHIYAQFLPASIFSKVIQKVIILWLQMIEKLFLVLVLHLRAFPDHGFVFLAPLIFHIANAKCHSHRKSEFRSFFLERETGGGH